jgi:hypothetical protein
MVRATPLFPPPDHYPQATALARSFPCLVDCAGLGPFDPIRFHKDLINHPRHSNASRQAGLFVLSVFNGNDWKIPRYEVGGTGRRRKVGDVRFNVVHAFSLWDDRHRRAFMAWAVAPWWL